jgi:hypothetical protein
MATKAQELLVRIAKQKEDVSALQALWAVTFPEFETLDTRQAQVWLKLYQFDTVVEGIETTNIKFSKRQHTEECLPMDREDAIKYASGVMKGVAAKEGK